MILQHFVLLFLTTVVLSDVGNYAVKQLLQGARFLHNFAYGEKVYMKKGGYQRALQDFSKVVDPKSVKEINIGVGVQGTVGDKTIRLMEAKGFVMTPSLSIHETNKGGLPYIIIKYKN